MLICREPVHLAATASYLPAEVVTNEELVRRTGLPVTPEWITERTGIRERRWAAPEQVTSDLVAAVVRQLCAEAGLAPEQLSRLIVSTTSPDYPTPSTACVAHAKLGVTTPFPCCDLAAACTGFLYGLDLGARAVLTGETAVAVVAAEIRSRFLNHQDPSTVVLFGDGAGGALLTPGGSGPRLLASGTFADGAGAHSVYIPAGGSARPASPETVAARAHTLHMADGARLFHDAVEGLIEALLRVCEAAGVSFDEIDLVVPHQANGLLIDEVTRRLELPPERIVNEVAILGNTSSSSVPLILDRAARAGRLRPGQLVALTSVGGGHTAGAALLRVAP